jgi:hypothetical protein
LSLLNQELVHGLFSPRNHSNTRWIMDLCCLLLLVQSISRVASYNGATMVLSQADRKLIDHCRQLSPGEYIDFINQLGRNKELQSLHVIAWSDLPNSRYAVGVLATEIDDGKAVAFCKQFQTGSPRWRAAFWNLDAHRKDVVIDYVREMSKSADPEIRYICYQVCIKAKWGDLLRQAKNDLGSPTAIIQPGTILGETLGRVAALYVDIFEH